MKRMTIDKIAILRLAGLLEGTSLLLLLGLAVPMKYGAEDPRWTKILGPIHGILFLWYVLQVLSVGVEQGWKFKVTTWKVLLGCLLPFGTFYIDHRILSKLSSPKERD